MPRRRAPDTDRNAARPVRASRAVGSQNSAFGPHSAQAIGSAWKRRQFGFEYSAWHAAHSGKRRMVVRARSYGGASMTLKRGPQFMQHVNGYKYRRSDG